jgi:hypothetical protein
MLDNQDRELIKKLNQETRKSPYYAKLTERKYRHLSGYTEYDEVMLDIARTRFVYDYYSIEQFKEDFIHRTSLILINSMFVDGFSSFWLSPDLFTAFLHTDLPDKLYTFRRVIKNCVLFLPEGLYTPDRTSVKWLLFNHRLQNEAMYSVEIGKNKIYPIMNDSDSLSITFYDAMRYQYSTNRSLSLKEGKFVSDHKNENFILRTNEKSDEDVEKRFMDKVFNVVVNVLLFLQTYEEKELAQYLDVKVAQKQRSVKPSKKPKLEPYVIGAKYKTKQQSVKREGAQTHKKIQHWRRGHYRNQTIGSRENPQHKLVWIEPMLINAIE